MEECNISTKVLWVEFRALNFGASQLMLLRNWQWWLEYILYWPCRIITSDFI